MIFPFYEKIEKTPVFSNFPFFTGVEKMD